MVNPAGVRRRRSILRAIGAVGARSHVSIRQSVTRRTGASREANVERQQRRSRALPKELPRIEQVIEPVSIACPCGCGAMAKIGEDRTERLDVTPLTERSATPHDGPDNRRELVRDRDRHHARRPSRQQRVHPSGKFRLVPGVADHGGGTKSESLDYPRPREVGSACAQWIPVSYFVIR